MRKILLIVISIVLFCCSCLFLTACFNNGEQGEGTGQGGEADSHNYIEGVCEDCKKLQTEGLEYEYNEQSGTYTLKGIGICKSLNIYIPKEYNGKPVTAISERAFFSDNKKEDIITLEIPSTITSIGNYAFYGCTSLLEVKFNAIDCADFEDENNVFTRAGQEGEGFKLIIGKQVKKIPANLFNPLSAPGAYPKLNEVTFEEGSVCEIIGENAFASHHEQTTKIKLADSIISIGDNAFTFCDVTTTNSKDGLIYLGSDSNPYMYLLSVENTEITSPVIDSNCKFIGSNAFNDCNLLNIDIPSSVKEIGSGAFGNCSLLVELKIPDTVIRLGSVFSGWESLTSVTIGNGITEIEYGMFSHCPSLTNVVLPSGLKKIGEMAFRECTALTNIQFPDGLEYIGSMAFWSCDLLEKVEIPDSVTTIEDGAFMYCSSLTKVVIGDGVTKIGDSAFHFAVSLNELVMGENVEIIADEAFSYCKSLNSIYIPSTVKSLGTSVLKACDSLVNINVDADNIYYKSINGDLYNIDETILIQYAIGKEDKVYKVKDSVTTILDEAFFKCDALTTIEIHDNVTSIGEYAFTYCTALTNINIPKAINKIPVGAFLGCSSLENIVIPENITEIGSVSFASCTSLVEVEIPNSVTIMGFDIFRDCLNLTSINFDGTVEQWNNITKELDWCGLEKITFVQCTNGTVNVKQD